MARKLRQLTPSAAWNHVLILRDCEHVLRTVRDRLNMAPARTPQTAKAVQHAIKSVGGAIRHAERVYHRATSDNYPKVSHG